MVQTKCCVLMLDWDDTSMVCEIAEVLLEALRYRMPQARPAYCARTVSILWSVSCASAISSCA